MAAPMDLNNAQSCGKAGDIAAPDTHAQKPEESWDDCLKAAIDVSRQAGVLIREAFHADKMVVTKSCYADLVTETDKKVEEMIISFFHQAYPTHRFIGEESTKDGEHCVLTDEPTWVVDPIDGTTNFVHRFPLVAVSIALVVCKKTVVGVVYNPITDEMFMAQQGRGAFLNQHPISVTDTDELSRALVCAEFGTSRDATELDSKFASMRSILESAHGLRSLGSAALNMCSVAAGRLDAYWEFGLHAWDIAAADLIVREAGGVVTSTTGGPLDLLDRRMLCAGTEKLALQIIKRIKQIDNLRRD